MKKTITMLLMALAIPFVWAASLTDGYVNSSTVTLGQWNWNFAAVKAYADKNHVPLLMFYGSISCGYCDGMINNGLNSSVFRNWVKEHPICMVFQDKSQLTADAAKKFVKDGATSRSLPYMKIYWPKADGTEVNRAFPGRVGLMPSTKGAERGEQLVNSLELLIGEYFIKKEPIATFAVGNTEGNRLECEETTKEVRVPITRTGDVSVISTNTVWKDEEFLQEIIWASGQSAKEITVPVFRKTVALELKNSVGEAVDKTSITFVGDLKPSAANPLWIGEKFDFGDWTCDLDAAKEKVQAAEGEAYTLVSVQGSKWCPDCANTDRNFLDVKDEDGNNRFAAWAKSRHVALVSMDIPNFNGPNVTDADSPTLFSTNAYSTELARAKEFPQSGADASLTNKITRSGLGYLSRKGISSEDAEAQLVKAHKLVTTDLANGGFHSKRDTKKYRTGVPIFVILRKDGTVAARFTRFASESPMYADREKKWSDIIKRFDEMLALATLGGEHADKIENDYPGDGADLLAANGGKAVGEISHVDFRDVFRLDGMNDNALQKVTVTGTSDAHIRVSFLTLTTNGAVTVGNPVSGALTKEGISLEHIFTQKGTYYVEVAGASISSEEFAVTNPNANNFHPFELTGSVVLIPQEARATANAPKDSDQITMRLRKGVVYRIEGLDANKDSAALEPKDSTGSYLFTAKVDGDVSLTCASKGGTVTYQIWNPGQVAFSEVARTVREDIGKVKIPIVRTGGASGRVKLSVSLDTDATTLYNSEGERRFAFDNTVLVWKDGEMGETNVTVSVINDERFDGTGVVALKLTVDEGTPRMDTETFALTVTEDDTPNVGKAAFVSEKTTYVREGMEATVKVGRLEANDGPATVQVKASTTTVMLGGDAENGILSWENHCADEKSVTVSGLMAGKTVTLSLVNATGGLQVHSSGKSAKVIAVAANAPAFAESSKTFKAYRYVQSEGFSVAVDSSTLAGGNVSFKKISGTIPTGLKAVWDTARQAMVFSGVTTAKAGSYVASYQIIEKRGARNVPGLTTTVTVMVTDPTDVKGNSGMANASLAKSRTFKSLAVLADDVLAGTLQVTIPANGRMSAKYACANGTVSFTSPAWAAFDPETKAVTCDLTSRTAGFKMHAVVNNDASATFEISDPSFEGQVLTVKTDGRDWSKSNPATKWKGYYTVALPVNSETIEEGSSRVTPRGSGYLTLKMATSSAINSGTVKWAGLLPNGTAFSGATPLDSVHTFIDDEGEVLWASLPIFKKRGKDLFSAYLRIREQSQGKEERRCVLSMTNDEGADFRAAWTHSEKIPEACWSVEMGAYGSYYDAKEDLAGCCIDYYETTNLQLAFDVSSLGMYAGKPSIVSPVQTVVTDKIIKIADGTENPNVVRLSFSRATGVVNGSFKLPYVDASGKTQTVAASWKGVVVTGWGSGCGCGDYDMYLPFVNGCYYFSDKVEYATTRGAKTLSIKRGGMAKIDILTE